MNLQMRPIGKMAVLPLSTYERLLKYDPTYNPVKELVQSDEKQEKILSAEGDPNELALAYSLNKKDINFNRNIVYSPDMVAKVPPPQNEQPIQEPPSQKEQIKSDELQQEFDAAKPSKDYIMAQLNKLSPQLLQIEPDGTIKYNRKKVPNSNMQNIVDYLTEEGNDKRNLAGLKAILMSLSQQDDLIISKVTSNNSIKQKLISYKLPGSGVTNAEPNVFVDITRI